jgi:hypothetical protein
MLLPIGLDGSPESLRPVESATIGALLAAGGLGVGTKDGITTFEVVAATGADDTDLGIVKEQSFLKASVWSGVGLLAAFMA